MSVDKFERNGDRTTAVYSGINTANLAKSFQGETEVIPQLELYLWMTILLKMWRIRCEIKMLQQRIM